MKNMALLEMEEYQDLLNKVKFYEDIARKMKNTSFVTWEDSIFHNGRELDILISKGLLCDFLGLPPHKIDTMRISRKDEVETGLEGMIQLPDGKKDSNRAFYENVWQL